MPSNGLIGCYSADGSMIFATAFEPYQELFQGVIRCLHSDFRLGGLKPGERLEIRGKIYIVKNDEKRYSSGTTGISRHTTRSCTGRKNNRT